MDILDLETTVNPDWWIKQLTDCDWTAGHFLSLKETVSFSRSNPNIEILLVSKAVVLVVMDEKDIFVEFGYVGEQGYVSLAILGGAVEP